jgi:hypothetical protein
MMTFAPGYAWLLPPRSRARSCVSDNYTGRNRVTADRAVSSAFDTGSATVVGLSFACSARYARPVRATAQQIPLKVPHCTGCGSALTFLTSPPRWVCANPSCPSPTTVPERLSDARRREA